MKKYYPRIVDKLLDKALESAGAVLIEGPKWSGKTWTAANKSKSILAKAKKINKAKGIK